MVCMVPRFVSVLVWSRRPNVDLSSIKSCETQCAFVLSHHLFFI